MLEKINKGKSNFLIIGAQGLIGEALRKLLSKTANIISTTRQKNHSSFQHLDILSEQSISSVFEQFQPSVVFFAANLAGGVKYCQSHPQEAEAFHYKSVKMIIDRCRTFKSKFIFISTECVFDGKKEEYREEDPVKPINIYGLWKAKSEEYIIQQLKNFIIVRTMSVFGWQPKTTTPNAVMSTYFALLKKQPVKIPAFRWCTPTYVDDLAGALIDLGQSAHQGIFHVAGPTFLSRYDWLKRVVEYLEWDSSKIVPQTKPATDEVPYPLKLRLNTKKFQQNSTVVLHDLDEALRLLKDACVNKKQ